MTLGRFAPATRSDPSIGTRGEGLFGWLLVSPALLLFVVFLGGPLVAALVISTLDWNLLASPTFVGLANYGRLLSDPRFLSSALNTLVFASWSIGLHLTLGLGLALAVDRKMPSQLRYFLRWAFFVPQLIAWAVASVIWKYALDVNFGFVPHYLRQIGVDLPPVLVSPTFALPVLIAIDEWKTIGFSFIFLLIGLQTVPKALIEAATIDGANYWQRVRRITIPVMSPILLFVTTFTFINALQVFEPMYIMTNGGPRDTTRSIVMLVYETGFRRFEMGYAAAMATVILVFIMVGTLLILGTARRWVHYQ